MLRVRALDAAALVRRQARGAQVRAPVPGMPRGTLGEQPRFVSSCGAAASIDIQVLKG